jgi:hypothetical protein
MVLAISNIVAGGDSAASCEETECKIVFYWFIVWPLGLGGSLDAAAVMDFVDSGHDLILAAGATTSEAIREIATECGADFDEVIYSIFIASICGKWHVV